jgi:alpha-tubulin suppressor-like RCC1 family protein
LAFHFEKAPKRIVIYVERTKDGHITPLDGVEITDFSCGYHHTVAIDSKNRAFSWGFGGFGRLGHNEQRDEHVPRLIKFLEPPSRGVKAVFCGSTFSLVINMHGSVLLFGQSKRTGEANMYPKPIQDLSGWDIRCVACSQTSVVVAADDSVIAWGCSPTFGELVSLVSKQRIVILMDNFHYRFDFSINFSHYLLNKLYRFLSIVGFVIIRLLNNNVTGHGNI